MSPFSLIRTVGAHRGPETAAAGRDRAKRASRPKSGDNRPDPARRIMGISEGKIGQDVHLRGEKAGQAQKGLVDERRQARPAQVEVLPLRLLDHRLRKN